MLPPAAILGGWRGDGGRPRPPPSWAGRGAMEGPARWGGTGAIPGLGVGAPTTGSPGGAGGGGKLPPCVPQHPCSRLGVAGAQSSPYTEHRFWLLVERN